MTVSPTASPSRAASTGAVCPGMGRATRRWGGAASGASPAVVGPGSGHDGCVVRDAAEAVGNAHDWFARNDGWAPPDPDTLADWVADGVCRCPDECLVTPGGWCDHGLASWWLILRSLTSLGGS